MTLDYMVSLISTPGNQHVHISTSQFRLRAVCTVQDGQGEVHPIGGHHHTAQTWFGTNKSKCLCQSTASEVMCLGAAATILLHIRVKHPSIALHFLKRQCSMSALVLNPTHCKQLASTPATQTYSKHVQPETIQNPMSTKPPLRETRCVISALTREYSRFQVGYQKPKRCS